MKEWIEQGTGIVIIGGIIGAGLLARMVLFGYYVKLGKACKQIGTTRNKSLRYIKEGLQNRKMSGEEIKNAMVYTECRLAECRTFGIHVGAWEGIMEQSLLLVLLSSGLCALATVMCDGTKEQILACLFLGGIGGVMLVILDMLTGMKARYRRIRLQIRDYIENCRWTEDTGTAIEQVTVENLPERKQKEKLAKKEKLSKRKKHHGKAQEEKRRLTEELLRDRRCLEAQRLAERRERERDTEQLQAEAEAAATAVTITATEGSITVEKPPVSESGIAPETTDPKGAGMPYEKLLRKVLAEYLG